MQKMKQPLKKLKYNSADEFLLDIVKYGKPLECSLVGVFDEEGRGSRRDIDLPLHKDGDYTTEYKNKIDIVALYCINPGKTETVIELPNGALKRITLDKNEALLINNNTCRHGREGRIGKRLLLRVWIQTN